MLGLCCQYIIPIKKRSGNVEWHNITEEKNLQFAQFNNKKYSEQHILNTWLHNIAGFQKMLQQAYQDGIRLVRLSSNLLPLWDLVPSLHSEPALLSSLAKVGEFIISNGIRVTQHPSQFCVLSSINNQVIENSIKILMYHAWVFDKMTLPQTTHYAINIHGGTKNQADKLIDTINNLTPSARNRLTLENDERSYSVKDLLTISNKTSIPIVFDSHHHVFNTADMHPEDALLKSMETWNQSIKPLTHLSNTTPGLESGSFTERRKHSDFVHYIPNLQKELNNESKIDIECEFKMKNQAIMKMVKDFNISLR